MGLGLGYALHAVGATLELEDRIGVGWCALDRERVLALADLQRLGLEADAFGVAGEHPVDVARPQPGLVAAGAALDFDDHVLLVVWVALDHREADLLFELLDALARGAQHLAQLGIVAVFGDQLLRAGRIVAGMPPLRGKLGGRLQLTVCAADLGVAFAVADHRGVGHLLAELGEASLDLLDQLLDHAASLCGPAEPHRG